MSFGNELDTRAVEKTESDERLKQEIRHLTTQVLQKFVEIDTAISTISSMHAASSQAAPQSAPQGAPSGTEMEMSTWVRRCKMPPFEPRTRKNHRCCGHLPEKNAKRAAGGDWDGVNLLNGAILALA